MDSYQLDRDVAQRMAKTIRRVEGMPDPIPPELGSERRTLWARICRFELIDALVPGSSARARVLRMLEGSLELNETYYITVYDRLGQFRGREKDKYSSPHDRGSRGLAWKPHDCADWEIVSMQPAALMVRGLATAAFTSADSTITIDGVSVMQPVGGLITDQNPAGNLTVYNDTGFASDNNAIVKAIWNEASERWEIFDAPCPA